MYLRKMILSMSALCCVSLVGGTEEIPRPASDASYAEWTAYWKKVRPSGGKPLKDEPQAQDGTREFEVEQDGNFLQIKETSYKSAKSIRELVFQDNSVGYVYPGSLLWTQPLLEGRFVQLPTVPDRPVVPVAVEGIASTNTNTNPTFKHDGTFFDFQAKAEPLLREIKKTSPRLDLKIGYGKSLNSALLDMGLSASYWSTKFSVSASSKTVRERSFAVVSLKEVYYTMVADTPDVDGYFPPGVLEKNAAAKRFILKEMREKGEIGYVRRVNYGRRVLIAISAESSEEELKYALRLSAGGVGIKVAAEVDKKTQEIWEKMEAQAVVVGGKVTDALADTVTGGFDKFLSSINQYLKDTKAFDDETGAAPVSFEVRYCSDNDAFSNYETAEFAGQIVHGVKQGSETVPVRDHVVRLTKDDARLIRDDSEIDTDDWTEVGVSYSFSLTEDRRAVELTITMDAKELESDKSEDGNTHIRTSRKIRVYELAAADKRRIKEIKASPLQESDREYFRGELHDWFTFDDGVVGALRDIRVKVDANGRDDLKQQALEAKVDFLVEIDREK